MTTFLDSLNVQGLMGLSQPIQFDLQAPLTLIYAPNGTGKTSVWTAAKALLTADFPLEHVSKVAKAKPPVVKGNVRVSAEVFEATLTPDNLRLSGGNRKLAGTDALKVLASNVDLTGVQAKGGTQQTRLQSYISTARFLPSDSLLYLIDDDPNAAELRRRLFADLTGTSALQSERREVGVYAQRLQDRRQTLSSKVMAAGNAIKSIVDANAIGIEYQPALDAAYTLAGLDKPRGSDFSEQVAHLQAWYSQRSAALAEMTSASNHYRSQIAAYPALGSDLENAEAELMHIDGALKERLDRVLKIEEELRSASTEDRSRDVSALIKQLEDVLTSKDAPTNSSKLTLGNLRDIADEFNALGGSLALKTLERLNESRREYPILRDESLRIDLRLRTLLEDGRKSSAAIVSDILNAEERLANFESRYKSLADTRADILSLARSYVAETESSRCPCCSSDWIESGRLLDAISSSYSLLEIETASRANTLAEVTEEIMGLRSDLSARETVDKEIQTLVLKRDAIESSLASHREAAYKWNIEEEQLVDSSELPQLKSARFATSCSALIESFRTAFEIWQPETTLKDCEDLLRQAERNYKEEREALENHREDLSEQLRAIKESIESLRVARNSVAEKFERLHAARTSRDQALLSMSISGPEDLESFSEKFSNESSLLSNVSENLSQAVVGWQTSITREAEEKARTEISQYEAAIELLDTEIGKARSLESFLQTAEKDSSSFFFKTLGPAVEALFSHMQVNRIFSQLQLSTIDETFNLQGVLPDGSKLSPGADFSMGQRQDLALSMFLIRAASLGGTFVLDEPLTHLDDLNRTALLDCIRACILGTRSSKRPVRLIVTTASWSVARHLIQKFSKVAPYDGTPALRVYQLQGNPTQGVTAHDIAVESAAPKLARGH